jgi:ubiquinone/menaquinone biosynthesis C-methylase UbiE
MSSPGRRIAENRAAHDRLGGAYDARHPEIFNDIEQARLVASVARAVAAIASPTPAEQRVMLDIGAGTGNLTDKLLAHPGRVLASDLSERMVRDLARRHAAVGRVDAMVLNGRDLRPAADASVDLVGAYSVLHHVPDYLALVDEMARVVRPGGVILLEHEKAPQYWTPSAALREFLEGAVVWPEKRLSRFIDPRRYWARVRPLLVWQRWTNPRWMPEGDLHIWPDDHLDWDAIDARLRAAGCEIVLVEDHLAYEPRFDRAAWERARAVAADTRVLVARRLAPQRS